MSNSLKYSSIIFLLFGILYISIFPFDLVHLIWYWNIFFFSTSIYRDFLQPKIIKKKLLNSDNIKILEEINSGSVIDYAIYELEHNIDYKFKKTFLVRLIKDKNEKKIYIHQKERNKGFLGFLLGYFIISYDKKENEYFFNKYEKKIELELLIRDKLLFERKRKFKKLQKLCMN